MSPSRAQLNGLAEECANSQRRLSKADVGGSDPYVGFLEYCYTPTGECGSPAQMLMDRCLRHSHHTWTYLDILYRVDFVRVQGHGSGEWHPAVVRDVASTAHSFAPEHSEEGHQRYTLKNKESGGSEEQQNTDKAQHAFTPFTQGSTEDQAACEEHATARNSGAGQQTVTTTDAPCTCSGGEIKQSTEETKTLNTAGVSNMY